MTELDGGELTGIVSGIAFAGVFTKASAGGSFHRWRAGLKAPVFFPSRGARGGISH